MRRSFKRLSILTATFLVLLPTSAAFAEAKECTPFGCHPKQGNPINELGGMIVLCALISMLLFGFARRYVK